MFKTFITKNPVFFLLDNSANTLSEVIELFLLIENMVELFSVPYLAL